MPGGHHCASYNVYRTYFPDSRGGIEEVIRQICLFTKTRGFDNRLLALSATAKPRVLRRSEANIYRAHRDIEVASCGMSLQAFHMYERLAKWADILHYHFPWPFGDLLHLTSRTKRPTVLTYPLRNRPAARAAGALSPGHEPVSAQRRLHRRHIAQLPRHQRRGAPFPGKGRDRPPRPERTYLPASLAGHPRSDAGPVRRRFFSVHRRPSLLQGLAHTARRDRQRALPRRHRRLGTDGA